MASESRCFLCHKDVCTIPHILAACKISVKQDRFTFQHDNVVQHLVLLLKSFLKHLPNNTTKKCNTIKFVKSGTKFPKINNVSKGILHLASDWILLADVKGDYVLPFQLALTELHPDIVLFSKSSKRVVPLEWTYPCEENMESWHSQKLNKYTPQRKCDQHTKHPGFFNKGNTCYANSVLQALSTIPSFWCQSALELGFLSPLTRAVTVT